MTTLAEAQKIIELFGRLDALKKRLAAIDNARATGTQIDVAFKIKNTEGHWGDIDGLKYSNRFGPGELNDIAAVFLARLSDQTAAQKRAVERDLAALGARP